jgi:SAM-dependent methyltransferase
LGGNDLNAGEQFQLSDEAAEHYERCPARYILGPWAPLLVNAARPAAGERVLDVACGTGVVARIAAERVGPGGRVVGVDLNPGMIRVARSLPAPIGAPIEWLERSALDLGLEDASFDVVLCQQGLQFFPDKALALRDRCAACSTTAAVLRSVCGRASALIIMLSATRSRGSYRPNPPSASARRDKSQPQRTCNASQRKRVLPTWKCVSMKSISTCRVSMNSR